MSSEPPEIASLLGKARPAWDALRRFLDGLDGVSSEWKFYGEKHGHQLKVSANRRALVYLIPREGRFTAAVALREPAIEALRASGFPAARMRAIDGARASTEGKPARIEVRSARDVALVKRLVAVKLGR